ncbi:MAG: hypothetical protein GYB65_14930 [Chloroflexi bacterium]|nr:hypothetical protein [Chloroflexota bacterium]
MDNLLTISEETAQVWSLLGTLAGTLLLLALTLWASAQITRQARDLWLAVRGHRGTIIAAVDDPTDALIQQLARLSHVPGSVWAAALPAFLGALADSLDQIARIPPADE